MNQNNANDTCQKALEESFGAQIEGWVDNCPSLLLKGTSKEVGLVLDIEGASQQNPQNHARIMLHSKDDYAAIQASGEWDLLRETLELHGYKAIFLVDMTRVAEITEGKSVADIMERV